jgi:hypothetical protein
MVVARASVVQAAQQALPMEQTLALHQAAQAAPQAMQ